MTFENCKFEGSRNEIKKLNGGSIRFENVILNSIFYFNRISNCNKIHFLGDSKIEELNFTQVSSDDILISGGENIPLKSLIVDKDCFVSRVAVTDVQSENTIFLNGQIDQVDIQDSHLNRLSISLSKVKTIIIQTRGHRGLFHAGTTVNILEISSARLQETFILNQVSIQNFSISPKNYFKCKFNFNEVFIGSSIKLLDVDFGEAIFKNFDLSKAKANFNGSLLSNVSMSIVSWPKKHKI